MQLGLECTVLFHAHPGVNIRSTKMSRLSRSAIVRMDYANPSSFRETSAKSDSVERTADGSLR
jgi:hypothetical protein